MIPLKIGRLKYICSSMLTTVNHYHNYKLYISPYETNFDTQPFILLNFQLNLSQNSCRDSTAQYYSGLPRETHL